MKDKPMNLVDYIRMTIDFSRKTFGPPNREGRSDGVLDHLGKEIAEIKQNPDDIEEWCDALILAIDGAHVNLPATISSQTAAQAIADTLQHKLRKNMQRKWPDWRTTTPGQAIEHDRSKD